MGKTIYLTDKQLKLLEHMLDPMNFSRESGTEEEVEEAYILRDEIMSKVTK